MKRHAMWNQIVLVTVAAVLTFVSSLSFAQTKAEPSAKSQKASQSAEQKEQSHGGPQEGIKLHGHWSIVIKNPDGSVASHHEFENSLVNTGPDLLAQLLARAVTPGAWEVILLSSQGGTSPCSGGCSIFEPAVNVTGVSTNLTVTYAPNPARALLQGSVQASNAGDIAQVQTIYLVCQPSLSPTTCPGSLGAAALLAAQPFTQRALGTPITVQAGQLVQVTVTFTFS